MKVLIWNRQRQIRVRTREVSTSARKILLTLGCLKAELSLLLVNDAQIRRLNKRYRKINRPTDVLLPSRYRFPARSQLLGDGIRDRQQSSRAFTGA